MLDILGDTAAWRRWRLLPATLLAIVACSWPAGAGQSPGGAPRCQPAGAMARLPDLPEASGVAASRSVPGRLWTHNDSGQPVLVALNDRGAVTGRLRLAGANVEDWEAIAVGPCPGGSCLYVADIGDNDAERRRITVYRLPEPGAGNVDTMPARDLFHATYPDGRHDAEVLLVTPKGELLIVTKGDTGPVALYRFPAELRPGASVVLQRVGGPRGPGKPGPADRITDGAMSPTGEWIVLRTNGAFVVPPHGRPAVRQLARGLAGRSRSAARAARRRGDLRRRPDGLCRRRRRGQEAAGDIRTAHVHVLTESGAGPAARPAFAAG